MLINKSEFIKELATALSKFQSEIKAVKKDGENPFFKSKFATLDNIIANVSGVLGKNGLSFSQFPDGQGLTTILMHSSGEWIMANFTMIPKDNSPQAYGSMLSYSRRYALSAILGLATEEDDDGNSASTAKAKTKPAEPVVKHSTPPKVIATTKPLTETEKIKVAIHTKLLLIHKDITPANIHKIVKDLTQLELVETNYLEIINRLDDVIFDKEEYKNNYGN